MQHKHDFAAAMQADGLELPGHDLPIDDGKIQRFRVKGDSAGSENGWYVLHGDNTPAGSYGNWKTDETFKWRAQEEKVLSEEEKRANQKRVELEKQKRHKDIEQGYLKAADRCSAIWDKASPASNDHPYLMTKSVKAYGLKQQGNNLLVPARDNQNKLWSMQSISPSGDKLFHRGGLKKGRYHFLQGDKATIYICEGYATGATIHALSGSSVAIAFDAGNLQPVASTLKTANPDSVLVIACDNDHSRDKNIGLTKGRVAAQALSIGVAYPPFEKREEGSDFNDYAALKGPEAALTALQTITPPKAHPMQENSSDTNGSHNDEIEINRLAELKPLEYEREREAAAENLGIKRVSMLDKLVKAARANLETSKENSELTEGIEPWVCPVNGLHLANEIRSNFQRYTILPAGGDIALTLWSLGTYCYNGFRIFPKLCLSSPEKRCGKTTTLEVLGSVVHRSLVAANASPSVIFRAISEWSPSLLIDEGDTFLHGKEELRGVINSGHTRSSAFVLRTEGDGDNRKPVQFSTWAPMAIAMIKTPPDTIQDRSVMVTLRRKMPDEQVQKMPFDLLDRNKALRQKLQRWGLDSMEPLRDVKATVPRIGNDRAEDNWYPLLTIAEYIGGDWPNLALTALHQIESTRQSDDDGIGPMILADIRQAYEQSNLIKMYSEELVQALVDLEERPWCEWKNGQPMTKNSLARLLKPYDIKSKYLRSGTGVKRGYDLEQFQDAFSRYLPKTPFSTVTTLQPTDDAASSQFQSVTETNRVTDEKSLQPTEGGACNSVTLQNRENRGNTSKRGTFTL